MCAGAGILANLAILVLFLCAHTLSLAKSGPCHLSFGLPVI